MTTAMSLLNIMSFFHLVDDHADRHARQQMNREEAKATD